MKPEPSRHSRMVARRNPSVPLHGFTMIELLVVIVIILILAGIGIPSYLAIKQRQQVKKVQADIEVIQTALQEFKDDFGDFPNETLLTKKLAEKGRSLPPWTPTNHGCEVMVACLVTHLPELFNKSAYLPPSLTGDDGSRLMDHDGDGLKELTDAWNRPYVYFHNSEYHSSVQHAYSIGKCRPEEESAHSSSNVASAKTNSNGVFCRLTDFQIWSCGPNEVNDTNCTKTFDSPADDDIRNWSE